MKEHIVIGSDRSVKVPDSVRKIAIQYDHNVNTLIFDCPRYSDSADLSTMQIYINYMLPNKELGSYLAKNVKIDETDDTIMHFEWTITRAVTSYPGVINCLVCIKQVDSDGNEIYHWNSDLFQKLSISNGMECTEVIVETNPDIITQLLLRMNTVEDESHKTSDRLGGLSFVNCTQEEYDALESPDQNTVYYAVDENGKVTQYLGSAKLTLGSAPAEAIVCANGAGIIFGATKEEE